MKYILLFPITAPCYLFGFIIGFLSRSFMMGWVAGYICLLSKEMNKLSKEVDLLVKDELQSLEKKQNLEKQ